jgi:hypothetical protein
LALVIASLLGFAGQATAQNLVVNPGFETGDLTGWTFIPASSGSDFFVANNVSTAHTGTFAAGFGAVASIPDSITQAVPTTPNSPYTFSFWLLNQVAGSDSFQAIWNGTTVLDLTPTLNTFPYTQFTFNVTSSAGATTTIQFNGYDTPSFNYLDDVSVTLASVPEPASLALMGLSGVCVGGYLWARRRAQRRSREALVATRGR